MDPKNPLVLPSRRPRSLTLPLDISAEESMSLQSPNEQKPQPITHFQSQSLFFTRLPLEIRILIYNNILGTRTIHFFQQFSRTRQKWEQFHSVCPIPKFAPQADPCYEWMPGWWETQFFESPLYMTISISILLTCRQAYSEGINLLYSSNEFRFMEEPTMRIFPDLVSPGRAELLTAMTFSWNMIADNQPHTSHPALKKYSATWEALVKNFPYLRSLRVMFKIMGLFTLQGQCTPEQFQQAWLQPPNDHLVQLHGLEDCEILVPISYYRYLLPNVDVATEAARFRAINAPYTLVKVRNIGFLEQGVLG